MPLTAMILLQKYTHYFGKNNPLGPTFSELEYTNIIIRYYVIPLINY